MINAVMICLGASEESGNELLELLDILLSAETDADKKKEILEHKFHISMTEQIEELELDVEDVEKYMKILNG